MANDRRANQPGGTYFFTLVTYRRQRIFDDPANVMRLRAALVAVMRWRPFSFLAGVILPGQVHYLWTLPPGDHDFSIRIGRMKVLFTRSLNGSVPTSTTSPSRLKHRDSNIWQRRFWEHLIRGQDDLNRHLDYIHYNPVKHGLAKCPHAWSTSSFHKWAAKGYHDLHWCCQCSGPPISPPEMSWANERME